MTEEELVAARMRMLSTLSGATVHELRGAANSLALHLQVLNIEPDTDELRERQRRSLALVDQGRQRLFALAEVFVRHASAPDLRQATFDMAAVAADAVALARPYAVTTHRAELTLDADLITRPVSGRRDVVLQALVELLVHMLDGAETGARIAVGVEPNDRRVRVVIRSTVTPEPTTFDRLDAAIRCAGGTAHREHGALALELPAAQTE
jgi:signal transduction histidine kinase